MFARLVTFGSAVNTFRKQQDLPAAISVGATQLMAKYDLDAVFDWTDGTLLIAKYNGRDRLEAAAWKWNWCWPPGDRIKVEFVDQLGWLNLFFNSNYWRQSRGKSLWSRNSAKANRRWGLSATPY